MAFIRQSSDARSRRRGFATAGRMPRSLSTAPTASAGASSVRPRSCRESSTRRPTGLRQLPGWRITCFFVGRRHRHRGVADAALAGALEQIAELGGGMVESYPEDVSGRKVSGSFLNNGTLAMFERHGFTRSRQTGKHRWVVTRLLS